MLGRSDSCLKRLIAKGGQGSLVGSNHKEKEEGMGGITDSLRMIRACGEAEGLAQSE